MGSHIKGSDRYIILQGSAYNPQELQDDFRLVYYHGDYDDCAGRIRAAG